MRFEFIFKSFNLAKFVFRIADMRIKMANLSEIIKITLHFSFCLKVLNC